VSRALRRLGIILLVAIVGGGVAAVFHFNPHLATVHLGSSSTVELPMAVHLLGALAAGAGLVLLLGFIRSSVRATRGWRERRRAHRTTVTQQMQHEGRTRLWAGDFAGAGKTLARAAQREPEDLDTSLSLARVQLERGDSVAARQTLEAARARHGRDTRVLSALGRLALERGNVGEAIAALREAVEVQPESPRLLAELMTALAAEGRFSEAADVAGRRLAAEREPTRQRKAREQWLALRLRAAATSTGEDGQDQALQKLAREEPDFVPAAVLLADRARAANDMRTTERILRAALRRRAAGVLLERLVSLHAAGGEARRSVAALRDVCARNALPGPRLQLARTLVASDDLDAAESELAELMRASIAWAGRGVDIAPERDLVAGELALARGNDREAAKLFLRAATGAHAPFSHSCASCGRTSRLWTPDCACGAAGTYDWSVNGGK
jgi:uncharacterized protein HemY